MWFLQKQSLITYYLTFSSIKVSCILMLQKNVRTHPSSWHKRGSRDAYLVYIPLSGKVGRNTREAEILTLPRYFQQSLLYHDKKIVLKSPFNTAWLTWQLRKTSETVTDYGSWCALTFSGLTLKTKGLWASEADSCCQQSFSAPCLVTTKLPKRKLISSCLRT